MNWFLALLLVGPAGSPPPADDLPRLSRPFNLTEAKLLITLVESARKTMASGWPIEWQVLVSSEWVYFAAHNAGRSNPGGSVTVGHYAVNRHTADVWDSVSGKLETSPEIRVFQEILRQDRRITGETLEKWKHTTPLDALGEGVSAGSFMTRFQ